MDKKNKPSEKTLFYVFLEERVEGKITHDNKIVKFSTPGLGKDLTFDYSSKYNLDAGTFEFTETMDIFAKPNQKIIVAGKATYGSKTINSVFTAKSAVSNFL